MSPRYVFFHLQYLLPAHLLLPTVAVFLNAGEFPFDFRLFNFAMPATPSTADAKDKKVSVAFKLHA